MVNASQRKPPSELNVISKTKDLLKHTYQMTNNTKHFPKKEVISENGSTSIESASRCES